MISRGTSGSRISGKDVYLNETNAFPLETNGWSYFQGRALYTKLLDFWDRGLFTNGTSTGLDNDAANGVSGATLGLAEYCNGNFLGEYGTVRRIFQNQQRTLFPVSIADEHHATAVEPSRHPGECR